MHCAFIGTNGTGKSTLVNMILHPDKYLYDGKLIVDVPGRIGYVSQFYTVEEEKEITVFDYISEEFVRLQTCELAFRNTKIQKNYLTRCFIIKSTRFSTVSFGTSVIE